MEVFRIVVPAALALALGACATLPKAPASREAWEAVHTRTFPATPEQVSKAAEEVMRLADGDFTFEYPPGQLVGTRPWLEYVVIAAARGTDYWQLNLEPAGDGTKATLRITRWSVGVAPAPTAWGDTTVASNAMPGTPLYGAALYNLFWERVEYKLGLRDEWQTCGQYKAGKSTQDKASLNPLCSMNTDDNSP